MRKTRRCPCVKGFRCFGCCLSDGCRYAPKPGAIPTSLYPDIQFLSLYHGGRENQRFFCLWSFMWSKPLLCRLQQPGEIPQTQVPQGFTGFRLALSRIAPQHSQSRRATSCATPGRPIDYNINTPYVKGFLAYRRPVHPGIYPPCPAQDRPRGRRPQ